MNEKEAIKRIETGNFNSKYGFDWQLVMDIVGTIGEMIRNGQISEIIRCKNCIHQGKSEKCVFAAIAEEKDVPLFMLDYHGEWFCADGKSKENK